MLSLLSTLTVLCIQMLLVKCNPLQQVLSVDGVNFSVHVENQTQVRDTMSRRQHRVYQLYSRTSGKHVQVLGRRISARGEDGDKFAQLVVEADTFGSQVRIRGKATDFYLCMNRRGKLVGKKASNRSDDCVFVEKVLENHYTALMSARHAGCRRSLKRCRCQMTQSCRQTQTADSGGKRVYERNSIARQQESVLEGVVH
uniref:Fibroblast growth factor 18a n=1 Tax=Gasterosteus aculeatus aculeatus TaxID=481459 RepID=G3Q1C5_GASAC